MTRDDATRISDIRAIAYGRLYGTLTAVRDRLTGDVGSLAALDAAISRVEIAEREVRAIMAKAREESK